MPHASQWAFCYRKGAIVNTNMFVEAFHHKLKSMYFQGKQNHRIDRLLYTLLKIARDIVFQGLCKDKIGKRTYRKSEILKRCQAAEEIRDKGAKLIPDQEDIWQIEPLTERNMKYSVQLIKDSCDCQMKCTTCGACVHMYICSWIDYAVNYAVCKHTHVVYSLKSDEGSATND